MKALGPELAVEEAGGITRRRVDFGGTVGFVAVKGNMGTLYSPDAWPALYSPLCVSLGEKDAKLVVLVTYVDVKSEKRLAIPVGYRMLHGLKACDVAEVVVKSVVQSSNS